MLVSQNVRDSSVLVRADGLAGSTGKAITDGVVEKRVGIEMQARRRMEAKGIPYLIARTNSW